MTIELLTTQYRIPLLIFMILSPWVAYYLCVIIPGKSEEPYILSANLFVSALAAFILCIYLTFSLNRSDFRNIAREADIFLLISVPYHLMLSFHLAKKRMKLAEIPAVRIIKGAIVFSMALFILTAIFNKIRILVFSYVSFNTLLIIMIVLIVIACCGWSEMFDDDHQNL